VSGAVRLKICCIADLEEARMAAEAGAHAIGLVSEMPSGPGVIDEGTIAAIAAQAPPHLRTFLLTSSRSVAAIVSQWKRCRTTTLQLVDSLAEGSLSELRAELPGVEIVQVVHVTGETSFDEALAVAAAVDALLLDSGNPELEVKELGGTGRTHDWEISRRICERAGVPVFLAGGLGPDNVADAIRAVRPFGIDVCSGLRREGRLDRDRLARFRRAMSDA
jgi:phosphoribosylanthranilate isomerase